MSTLDDADARLLSCLCFLWFPLSAELSLTLSPANLLDCLETAVLLIYRMSTAKGLSLSYFIDPTIPDRLMIDSQRLQQVLLNLLSNAVKFCQVGSVKLEVSAELLPPPHHRSASQGSEETDPQQYQITMKVIDTGIGIEPKHMQLLFRSFSQVQHAGEYGGTGTCEQCAVNFLFRLSELVSRPTPDCVRLVTRLVSCVGVSSVPL